MIDYGTYGQTPKWFKWLNQNEREAVEYYYKINEYDKPLNERNLLGGLPEDLDRDKYYCGKRVWGRETGEATITEVRRARIVELMSRETEGMYKGEMTLRVKCVYRYNVPKELPEGVEDASELNLSDYDDAEGYEKENAANKVLARHMLVANYYEETTPNVDKTQVVYYTLTCCGYDEEGEDIGWNGLRFALDATNQKIDELYDELDRFGLLDFLKERCVSGCAAK